MTAVMSHMAKAEGVELKLALMVVPSTDLRYGSPFQTKRAKTDVMFAGGLSARNLSSQR
jgi:hypothetical protein